MDLDNLTTVTKRSTNAQNYDIRLSMQTGRYSVASRFYANKGMNSNGLTLHTTPNGDVLLSVQPNDDSVFYTGKESSDQKADVFNYLLLTQTLEDAGMVDENARFINLTLTEVGQKDGATYYQVSTEAEGTLEDEADEEPTQAEAAPSITEEEDVPVVPSSDYADDMEEDVFA